jgi:hypothetical protein
MTDAADVSWVPVTVAVIAAIATVTGQFLLNRREPFAIVRLQRLSEAIASLPDDDKGRDSLAEARTVLANRLAISLVGPRGFARFLRTSAWILAVAGTVVTVFWIVAVRVLGANPSDQVGQATLNTGIVLLVLSPLFLGYSALWPYAMQSGRVAGESVARLSEAIGALIVRGIGPGKRGR